MTPNTLYRPFSPVSPSACMEFRPLRLLISFIFFCRCCYAVLLLKCVTRVLGALTGDIMVCRSPPAPPNHYEDTHTHSNIFVWESVEKQGSYEVRYGNHTVRAHTFAFQPTSAPMPGRDTHAAIFFIIIIYLLPTLFLGATHCTRV